MHAAVSVILLTVLIGAGQGLFLALYTGESYAAFGLLGNPPSPAFMLLGGAVSLALTFAGLIASVFHLGHPERAWRTATCWRTSWLSREVIVLPAFLGLSAIWLLLQWSGWNPVLVVTAGGLPVQLSLVVGALATVVSFALYLSTAMIYASIRFIVAWHSTWTVFSFLLMGLATGFTIASALAALRQPELFSFYSGWALLLIIAAIAVRGWSHRRALRVEMPTTMQTAIGVRHTQIRQVSKGFAAGSFNTEEFAQTRKRSVLNRAAAVSVVLAGLVPLMLLPVGVPQLVAFAAITQISGLFVERWLFFVQVKHPQDFYYQAPV